MKLTLNKLIPGFDTRLNVKFVLLMVITIIIISAVYVTYGVSSQARVLEQRLQAKADALGEFVALVSPDAIYSFDITTLDQFVVQIMKDPEVLYAVILDAEHKRLTTVNPAGGDLKNQQLFNDNVSDWLKQLSDEQLVQYPIRHLNNDLGYLSMVLDLSFLQKAYYKSIREQMLIGVLSALILSLLIAYIFRRNVIAPILKLQAGARRIGQGNYLEPVKSESNDEIGELTSALNQMMSVILQEQAELVENNRELRRLTWAVEQSPASVVILNMNRQITYVNKTFMRGRGHAIESLTGKTLESLYPDLQASEFEKIWSLVLLGEIWNGELCYESRALDVCCEDVSIQAILDDKGNVVNYLSLMLDITQQKKTEELLRHTQKMDALGKLTGGVAHDFNNLLGIMLGYTELLKEKLSEQPGLQEYVDNIYSAGDRAQKLTSRLLSFSRKSPITTQRVDMNQLIQEEKNLLEKSMTAQITLSLDLCVDIWPVYIDKSSMQDVLLNLSINSMYAMPEGGMIKINTENCVLDETQARALDISPGDYVVLGIEDTGIGMSREVQDKMFDPFYTTKGDMGTGLGLSQVYGYIKQLSGGIHVISNEGYGTKITLYFPKATAEVDGFDKSETHHQHVSEGGSETIMLVDDEEALRAMAEDVLVSNGYTVVDFASAADALEYLKSNTVDLIISDVIMPEINGYQFAEQVMGLYPDMKIQMMSGYSENVQVAEGLESLRNASLNKPFKSGELLDSIRRHFDS